MAAELERRGVATLAIQLLREVALRVRPPRALFVPYLHGYPLGQPGAAASQRRVMETALRLLETPFLVPPVLVDFDPQR